MIVIALAAKLRGVLVLGLLILVIGVVLTIVGIRGRVIGDDPHCRACGFNLRGRDSSVSDRCSECGAELNDHSIRTGQHLRRPAFTWIGVVLLLAGLAGSGAATWQLVSTYDWTPWKPTAWLVDDLDSTAPVVPFRAADELIRRVQSTDFSQVKIDALLDRILARQADQSKKFTDQFGKVFIAAAEAKRVDRARMERFVKQGVWATLGVKPKIRRGQTLYFDLDMHHDRFGDYLALGGTRKTSPLMMDDIVMIESWAHMSDEETLAGTSGYGVGFDGSMWSAGNLPDGKHTIRATIHYAVQLKDPRFTCAPVQFDVPISTTVELFPKGATVDDFQVDAAKRDEMLSALPAARVTHDEKGHLDVRIKTNRLPVAIAAKVVLTQNGQEQEVGDVRIDAGASKWNGVYIARKRKFTGGVVDVHLRPDQSPADTTRTVGTYWGEEIVLKNITVDAPYTPPFNNDESLRPAVMKALKTPQLTRSGGKERDGSRYLSINLHADAISVKLAYIVYLRANGREVKGPQWQVNPSGGGQGYGTTAPDPDPAGKVTACDVIFRPDPDWEIHTSDLTPPWGGEIIFRDVPIK